MSLLKVAGNTATSGQLYVDSVFSTWLYTGNGSTQTITNGIDLAGKGGMTWIKSRSAATDHKLTDTVRGATKALISDTTGAQTTDANGLTAFSSTGFSIGTDSVYNTNAATYASWTFRKAAKFFDVVTFSPDGSGNATINQSLGSAPGMIYIKKTSSTSDWKVYHRSLAANYGLYLNTIDAAQNFGTWIDVSSSQVNFYGLSAGTYVAYLFAHDTASDGIIQCGSYTGNGSSTNPPNIELGWEPQFILLKQSSGIRDWVIVDNMRGLGAPSSVETALLKPNLSDAEAAFTNGVTITSTGFQPRVDSIANVNGSTNIYMAIRRPNKPPTSGTQVYNVFTSTSTETTSTPATSNITDDLFLNVARDGGYCVPFDRLRGAGIRLFTQATGAEQITSTGAAFDVQTGIRWLGTYSSVPVNKVNYHFKRAPGFFDVVCYTGTGSATTQAHNLGVAPELLIVKERSAANDWWVYNATVGNTKYSVLNSTAIPVTSSTAWNNTTPTSSVFSIGTGANVNASTQTYVAYLFATLAGISKVGSYTGNGSSQNIDCGFAAGARFFLVKATSTTGSWWVWDSARGIVAGNDPALQLNSTAAEITTADAVDPYSPGITVNQEATCSINASGVSYIFLAVA